MLLVWENLGKSEAWAKTSYLCGNHWKQLGWTQNLGGARLQGITWVGQTVIARLMESPVWHLPAGSVRGRLRKSTMASASTSVWERAVPPALALMPDNSFSPCMSLMSFNILPLHWGSEEVSPSKSVSGPFKRNCLGIQQFVSSTA